MLGAISRHWEPQGAPWTHVTSGFTDPEQGWGWGEAILGEGRGGEGRGTSPEALGSSLFLI